MPRRNRLFVEGRRVRHATILSLTLVTLLGGSLTWSARARAQATGEVPAASVDMAPAKTVSSPTAAAAAAESDSEAATRAGSAAVILSSTSAPGTGQAARHPAYAITFERTLNAPDGQRQRVATTARYQRADGALKLVHTFYAPDGPVSGGTIYFGLVGLGYFRLDETNSTLVFTTPVSADEEPEDVEAFLRGRPQFDREEELQGQRTIVWRMADKETQGTTEEWRAPALGGLLLKRVVASPRGQDIFAPTEITLGDPSPGLFAELSSYAFDYSYFEGKIQEMERVGNKEVAHAMREALHRMRAARPATAR